MVIKHISSYITTRTTKKTVPLIGVFYNRLSTAFNVNNICHHHLELQRTGHRGGSEALAPRSRRHVEIQVAGGLPKNGGEKWREKSDENDSKWMISRGTPLDMENSHWSMNGWLCIHHNWLFNHGKCCFIHQKRCFYRHNKLMNHDNWLSNHDTCLFGHVSWQFKSW